MRRRNYYLGLAAVLSLLCGQAFANDPKGEAKPRGEVKFKVRIENIPKPYLNAELVEALGATYVTSDELPVADSPARFDGGFDLIFEATGYSPVVFDSMLALAKNGVLVLSSVTGGDRRVEVPADRLNLEFVLGNKVMVGTVNANREYFEAGVRDMSQAELEYPGWLSRLLTHPVKGLENYRELFEHLKSARGAIKVYCEVSDPSPKMA